MCGENWSNLQGVRGGCAGRRLPQWGKLLGSSEEKATGDHSCSGRVTDAGVPAFFLTPICLRMSQLHLFLGGLAGRNQSGFLTQRLKSLGEPGAHPHFLSPRVGDSGWRVSAGASLGWCGRWGDASRRKVFFFLFFVQ